MKVVNCLTRFSSVGFFIKNNNKLNNLIQLNLNL